MKQVLVDRYGTPWEVARCAEVPDVGAPAAACGDKPIDAETRRLMAVFSPHRSLATTHLWQFSHPIPS